MVDVHVHVGEGALLPAEAIRLARCAGYRALMLVVRVDSATLSQLLPWLLQMCRHYSLYAGVDAFAGVELVHVPPPLLYEVVAEARMLGAGFVAVHGESPVSDAEAGTNLSAIQSGADVLFHPGLITDEEAALAVQNGVALEITSAGGHGLCNAHVAAMAEVHGCGLVFGGNVRRREDFVTPALYEATLKGAQVTAKGRQTLNNTTEALMQRFFQG